MKNSHSITELFFHLVVVTKYRQPVDWDCDLFYQIFKEFDVNLIELNDQFDHVHLLFEAHPSFCLSSFICKLKSLYSGRTRRSLDPHFPGFQRGYFCRSVGGSGLKKVQKYIQNQ